MASDASLAQGGGSADLLDALRARAPQPDNAVTDSTSRTAANGAADGAGEATDGGLWGSILNSVNSSKAVPTKNVILLGEPKSGKSTLLSFLAASSPTGFVSPSSGAANLGLPRASLTNDTPAAPNGVHPANGTPNPDGAKEQHGTEGSVDLGLGYGYFDVGDEDGEEVIARVGVYQLHSSHPTYVSLLPYALPSSSSIGLSTADTASGSSGKTSTGVGASVQSASTRSSVDALRDSLILITLDWEAPWTFLEQLRTWLDILREAIDGATGSALGGSARNREMRDKAWSRAGVVLDEMRERLEAYVRSYVEPHTPVAAASLSAGDSTDAAQTNGVNAGGDELPTPAAGASAILPSPAPIAMSSALDGDTQLPLGEGTLTQNWGLPIVVVCTKADTISKLERERDFKEEQFDYIQQVLRTVCLKYGAALFFTAQTRPQSFDILRSYVLHRLFTPSHSSLPAATQASANGAPASGGAAAGGSTAFPFPHRASTVDRDTLLVPSGWDSWGKIRVLREGFDCRGLGRGWEFDCEVERVRRAKRLPRARAAEEEAEKEVEKEDEVVSAVRLFEDIVSDWEAGPAVNANQGHVRAPDEQAFLAQHYATLQNDPDPRSKFTRQSSQGAGLSQGGGAGAGAGGAVTSEGGVGGRSVVGPMGSSSLSLQRAEKAMLERENSTLDDVGAKLARMTRKDSNREGRSTPTLPPGTSATASGRSNSSGLSSPSLPQGGSSGGGGGSGASRPTSPGGSSPGAPKQSEVLHSFFQSLLKDNKASSAAGGAAVLGASRGAGGRGAQTDRSRSGGAGAGAGGGAAGSGV